MSLNYLSCNAGCMGRVLLYNTQPVQFTSQPLFVCEIAMLPFQPMEPIIDLCRVIERRAVGLLSSRYFVLWQYAPIHNVLIQLCNPHRMDFIRCHYNTRFDLIVLGFIDGLILLYNLNPMKQLRRYQSHWKTITGLQSSKQQNLLISSSLDRTINVWNLGEIELL
jgi:WD40 repeat protein